ncbi:exonuclease SbcCD D subunit [Clostridium sp. CAG:568]|nr:exonuclease SbcCD D subunit [Clostridium sp. CAG:568]
MKILHTSDLHIGKYIGTYDLKEDTEYVLNQVVDTAIRERVEVILISGDVFDRPNPSEEAIKMYVSFLKELLDKNIKVIAISGNHDSGIRLSAYKDILGKGYFVEGEFNSPMRKVSLNDEYGPVNFYMLPFFTPFIVKSNLKLEKGLENYDLAMDEIIKRENIDTSQRNIILAHQFVAGFKFGGSEEDFSYSNGDEKNVAGVGIISLDKFQNFDYVALGHIHKPQKISRETIRYSGSLLKYKTSEIDGPDKSVVIIDLKEKGNIEVKLDPIKPLHPFVKIEGLLSELTNTNPNENDYVYLIVDDDKTPIEAKNKLTPYYKRIVDIEFPNDTLQQKMNLDTSLADKRPIDFICEYYREKTNKDLDEENKKLLAEIFIEANKEGGQN